MYFRTFLSIVIISKKSLLLFVLLFASSKSYVIRRIPVICTDQSCIDERYFITYGLLDHIQRVGAGLELRLHY